MFCSCDVRDPVRDGFGSEGSRGDHVGDVGDEEFGVPFLADDFHEGMVAKGAGDFFREAGAVYDKGLSSFQPVLLGGGDREGTELGHFSFEESRRCVGVIGLETIGAHQFCEVPGFVGGGKFLGSHLVEAHPDAPLGGIPGAFGACEPASDDHHERRSHIRVEKYTRSCNLIRVCFVKKGYE
jgi:hypothetical protein